MSRGKKRRRRRAFLAREAASPSPSPALDRDEPSEPPLPPAIAARAARLERVAKGIGVPAFLGFLIGGEILSGMTNELGYGESYLWGLAVDKLPLVGELYYMVRITRERGTIFHSYGYAFGFTLTMMALFGLAAWLVHRLDRLIESSTPKSRSRKRRRLER